MRQGINAMRATVLGGAPLAVNALNGAQNALRTALQAPIANLDLQGAAALVLGQAALGTLPGIVAGATGVHPLSAAALAAQNHLGQADAALAAAPPRHLEARLLLDHVTTQLAAAGVGAQPAHAPVHVALATIEGHLRQACTHYGQSAQASQRAAHVALLGTTLDSLVAIHTQANTFINNDIPTARAKVTGGASNNALGDALAELDGLQAAAEFLSTFAIKQVEQRAQVLTEVVEGTTAL